MEPRELIYNVYKDITSIKTKFDDENLWCNPYKTIQGLTPMTPGYVISMEYAPHIDIEEYFSEEFIEKLELLTYSSVPVSHCRTAYIDAKLPVFLYHPVVGHMVEEFFYDYICQYRT